MPPSPRSHRTTRHDRATRAAVRRAERLARAIITVGGIATILLIGLIFVFLVWVIAPLFTGADLDGGEPANLAGSGPSPLVELGPDVHGAQVWTLDAEGVFESRALTTGEVLTRHRPEGLEPEDLRCLAVGPVRRDFALGYSDGTLVHGELRFRDRFLSERRRAELAPPLIELLPGESAVVQGGVLERTRSGAMRETAFEVAFEEPVRPHGEVPVLLVDRSTAPKGKVFALLTSDDRLSIGRVRVRENMLTGVVTRSTTSSELPYRPRAGGGAPAHLLLTGLGNRLFLVWKDGFAQHYLVDGEGRSSLVEEVRLLDPGRRLTAFAPILGKNTFLVGDETGAVSAWFATVGDEDDAPWRLVRAHRFPRLSSGYATAFGSSPRTRTVAIGTSTGRVDVVQVTTERTLGSVQVSLGEEPAEVSVLAFDDREEHLLVVDARGRSARLEADLSHPEVNLAALFEPLWYEGYGQPEHVWQSTGGSGDFEPKFGLTAVVFGTVKATFYSMLFGAPLALLAAVFTSEFLRGRARSTFKSILELMASLPSVVLGFLAAVLVAPFVQEQLSGVLAWFLLLPLFLLGGAHLWQLLPLQRSSHGGSLRRLGAVFLTLGASVVAARIAGPWLEAGLFAGDIEAWLTGRVGSAFGGWVLLLLPVGAVLATLVLARALAPRLRRQGAAWSRAGEARAELLKFVLGVLLAVAIAVVFAAALGPVLGLDLRESLVGSYDQRNALVVGFVMGFAIVPVIYTLAEDALASVPEHLREASLGAGATPWQTAIRVVLPIAASGIFSALMIGLGRAVGETMIVLMAAGGTAILDWNVFNGFRTLSANIATELPESVVGGTHYRVLFFAGFLLFVMTFVLNTLAELVRQRFRKRAVEL